MSETKEEMSPICFILVFGNVLIYFGLIYLGNRSLKTFEDVRIRYYCIYSASFSFKEKSAAILRGNWVGTWYLLICPYSKLDILYKLWKIISVCSKVTSFLAGSCKIGLSFVSRMTQILLVYKAKLISQKLYWQG